MKLTVLPAAREDILQQFRYYLIERDAEPAANRFIEAVQLAVEEVRRHPEMGARKVIQNRALQSLRTWAVTGFPSVRIYYLYQENAVRVLRVLHGKRDIDSMLDLDEGPF